MSRFYRKEMRAPDLVSFRVRAGESDLFIWAERDLSEPAREILLMLRRELEGFIARHPLFKDTLLPYEVPEGAPPIVKAMSNATLLFGVGPMASVAGAISDFVGGGLLPESGELIVENGGDLFIASGRERRVGVFAGDSPLSGRLALRVGPSPEGLGVCTSSATVGPSLSLGRADAALVVAENATLADAAASALGNRTKKSEDIEGALEYITGFPRIKGALVIMGEHLGVAGDIDLVKVG